MPPSVKLDSVAIAEKSSSLCQGVRARVSSVKTIATTLMTARRLPLFLPLRLPLGMETAYLMATVPRLSRLIPMEPRLSRLIPMEPRLSRLATEPMETFLARQTEMALSRSAMTSNPRRCILCLAALEIATPPPSVNLVSSASSDVRSSRYQAVRVRGRLAPTTATPGAAFQDSSPSAAPSSFMPTPDPSCSAFSQCAGIPGDCCPAADGVDLFCCGSSDPSCSANPKCAAEGLGDNCCPTSDNVFLDCCEKSFAQCAAYPQCAHMMGDCCPTTSGVMLDCCLTDPALASVAFDSNPESAQCSSFDPCAGLTGDCCPTDAGIFLYCCENVDTACTNHPKCAALGLENACCPTSDGMYLDCCERDFADAASSSACTAQNVTGTVCPDAQGVFADCCVNDLLARSLVFAAASVPTPQSTSGYAPVEPGRYLWSMMMLASLVFVV
jgi:hypothetical protein